jgi:hypothetical protein
MTTESLLTIKASESPTKESFIHHPFENMTEHAGPKKSLRFLTLEDKMDRAEALKHKLSAKRSYPDSATFCRS